MYIVLSLQFLYVLFLVNYLNLTLISFNFFLLQDMTFKVQRQQHVTYRVSIQNDNPWKLHQVQDAGNHLQQAILHIDNIDKDYSFRYFYNTTYFNN